MNAYSLRRESTPVRLFVWMFALCALCGAPCFAGPPVIKLNPEIPEGESVSGVSDITVNMTPDSRRVVFSAYDKPNRPGYGHIYNVSLTGHDTVAIVPLRPNTTEPQLSPDGAWVLYLRNYRLYSNPAMGGGEVQLTTSTESVGYYEITPDSSRVVYRSRIDLEEDIRISCVPIEGGYPQG